MENITGSQKEVSFQSDSLHYLKLLAEKYPSIQAVSTEIIKLTAQLHLPKGTEHFVSDIHGAYEAFLHVLKNGSGSIRRRIDEIFANDLSEKTMRTLATLIYYPEQKIPAMVKDVDDPPEWYRLMLFRLIRLARVISAKYTRATVREAFPAAYADIMEELLYPQDQLVARQSYYQSLLESIVQTDQARPILTALAHLIQRLSIAHLHIIGDIYDRGPGAHIIMDELEAYHSLDIQWGNHDIVWMGAAAGGEACIANVIRVALRYSNTETLENGYGISLIPLVSLAMDVYGDDPCDQFMPQESEESVDGKVRDENELRLIGQMQKAITIIQFKLEGQIIQRRPHFQMEDRLLLDKIDYERGVVRIDGRDYDLIDTRFPTIDPADPYALTDQEQRVVDRLKFSFQHSQKLQSHVRFLYAKGSIYLVHNHNLLYHGCIPFTNKGEFAGFLANGQAYKGREFLDRVDLLSRQAFFATDEGSRQYGQDAIWYLWCGPQSPLFGKSKMATFERAFIADEGLHKEVMNPYYALRDDVETADLILEAFGLDPQRSRIINGHVPVKVKKGESPIKSGGKLLVIDGGFSKAYQKHTGIAGYTLVGNSYGFLLASHEPFESTAKAIYAEEDIHSRTEILQKNEMRILTKDTDIGVQIQKRIDELQALVRAYQLGLVS